MKKTNRFIAVLSVAAMLFGMGVQSVFAEPIGKNFDSVEEFDTAGAAATGNLDGLFYSVNEKQAVGVVAAPKADTKYSTLSDEGTTDKAVKLEVTGGGSLGQPFVQFTGLPNDLYEMGQVRISFNVYVNNTSGSSHAPIQVGLRTENGTESTLVGFRTSKQMQFNGSATYQRAYSYANWYNVMFDINTVEETYVAYVNGEKAFDEIAMSNSNEIAFDGDNPINAIRFYINTAKNSTGSVSYFDDLYIGEPVSTSTDTLILESFGFNDGEAAITEITPETGDVYAEAQITYSEKTAETPVDMYAAVFGADGVIKEVFKTHATIPQAAEAGEFQQTVSMPLSFTEAPVEGDRVEVYIWDEGMKPLGEAVSVNVTDGRFYYLNQNFSDQSSSGVWPSNVGTEPNLVMETSVTNELNDEQGYAYKMACVNVPSSGMPFITLTPSETLTTGTVTIEMKLWMDGGTHPRTLTLNGRDKLLEFRPTNAIQGDTGAIWGEYEPATWQSYRIVLDMDGKTFTAYMGTESLGSGTFNETTLQNLRFTVQYNRNNTEAASETYIDDIKIY